MHNFSDEQVEAAAKALRANEGFMAEVHSALEVSWSEYIARLVLTAAQGAARPVNSFDTTAERVKTGADSLHVAPQESSRLPDFFAPKPMPNDYIPVPQEPNQNETKSGNNFVSLDPEKVADVLRLAMRAEAMMFEDGGYEWIAESDPDDCLPHIAHALCEAYTEGKLT